MQQRPVVEHRQVETPAVPRHELRHVALQALVEALDQRGLRILGLADRPHLDALVVAHDAADRHDPLQVRLQEIAAGIGRGHRTALLERNLGDFVVGQRVGQLVEAPDAGDVRDGLYVECEDGCQRGPGGVWSSLETRRW